ncbi:uncharacterized protein LOC134246585 [Saccostrea cucullata]|uniref:uncharacterized protein LOC134246585 n=1 Tax=Saccostrea cuccullata TaxID=36930 RepID=UPI002ED5694A
MALSKALFSSDRTRFVRLALVIVEELTPVLRDVIENEISSNVIYNLVKSNKTLLKKLRNDQLLIIQNASNDGYRDFDINLLYTLIRNLCPSIPPPTQGWGISELPTQGETSVGDDIERIRLIKNNLYSHASSTCISETEFTDCLTVISNVCQRMGSLLHKNYVQSLQKSQHRPLDEELEKKWMEKIKESCEREKDILEVIATMAGSVERLEKGLFSATATVDATLTDPAKNEVAVLFLNTTSDLLNHIVDCIDEHITEYELRELYDTIEEFLKDESKEITLSLLKPFLEKLSSKIKTYANTHLRKFNILLKFTKFILDLNRKYGAEIGSRIGSLLLKLTFRSEKGLEIYNKDLEGGDIGKMILDLLLYPPYLACFDLQTENLIILLNNQIIYHNTDKEQFGGRLTNKADG